MRPAAALLHLALFASAAAAAAEPRIKHLQAELSGRQVLVSVELAGALDSEMRARVESGLPTGIVYDLELAKDRKRWWDRPLQSSTLQLVAMYNAVTRDYLVNVKLDGKLIESRQVHTLADLEIALTKIDKLPVFTIEGIPEDWRLLILGRAELGSRTVFAFIPTHVTTPWVESNKFRPRPPA
jgi:hypothetical protein